MRKRWRWAAPVSLIALVAAGTLGASTLADADPGLPPTTAEQLVTDVLTAKVPGMSGTVATTAELGLPDLSVLGGRDGGAPALTDWLSGTHTMRVWQAGEDRQRVSVPSGANEYGVYRSGDTTWLWSSAEQKATKITGTTAGERPAGAPTPPTPQEAAKQLLDQVGSTSTITLASNATVAGRSAYKLVVTPSQTGSKIGRIELAVDGATKVPLRMEVFGDQAADPAVSIGFTAVDFAVPADSVFAFTPPPGAKVDTKQADADRSARTESGRRLPQADPDHQVVGSGWQTVLVVNADLSGLASSERGQLQQVLNGLPRVKGSWGSGRLFDGPLFSAVLTDDGRIAIGAVVPDQLYGALT